MADGSTIFARRNRLVVVCVDIHHGVDSLKSFNAEAQQAADRALVV